MKEKEVKIKRARGMSLRACVAKAARWTLEQAKRLRLIKHNDLKRYVFLGHENYFAYDSRLWNVHMILKTITRTRTIKGGGFGLTIGMMLA